MGRSGRLGAVIALVALVAAGLGVAYAMPAGAQTFPGVDCGSKTSRWLFWPKGHGAVKSQGFPAFPTPHLEVYKGTGKKFVDADQIAYADPTSSKTASTCTAGTITQAPGKTNKTITKTAQLVCTFSANAQFLASAATGGGYALVAYDGGKPLAVASFTPTGSQLRYDSKACKVTKPPK